MAKKRKHAKKAARAAPKQKSNVVGWVIAAIVIIAIVLLIKPSGEPEEVIEEVVQAPEPGTLQSAEAPDFDKKCTIAGGVVPGTKTVVGNIVTVTYKNAGRVANEGTYFEFKDTDGNIVYRKNSEAVASGATIDYTVDLDEVAVDLGSSVKTFTIFPVAGGKACLNQGSYVIR